MMRQEQSWWERQKAISDCWTPPHKRTYAKALEDVKNGHTRPAREVLESFRRKHAIPR
jgi:hypothetical protein